MANDIETVFKWAATGQLAEIETALTNTPELVSATNAQGISLLLWAMYHRQKEIAKVVYKAVANPSAEEAVAMNDVDTVRALMKQEPAIVKLFSSDGFTLLHYACFFASLDCVEYLLTQNVDINCPAQNPIKVYPLHSAAAAQSIPIVKLLLAADANPNVQQTGGFTALMSAAAHNNIELIKLLLQYGADKTVKDDESKTAYDHGFEKGFDIETLIPG
jgi:ankyrin repeat protein